MVYHCKYCVKDIKHKSSWSRHQKTKKHLNNKNLYNEEKKEEVIETITTNESDKIKRLEDIIMRQTEMINKLINKNTTVNNNDNTTNNTTNNTINNNDNRVININIVGGEDFKGVMNEDLSCKFIDLADIKQLVLDTYLKQVYINRKENRNIEYNDTSRKGCKVYKGNGQWDSDDIDNVIEKRIKMSKQILPKMFKEMEDYDECKDAYTKVCKNVKDFVNNEQGTEEYNSVVKNHKQDIRNINFEKSSEEIYTQCKCCSRKVKNTNWEKHLKCKTHMSRTK